MLFAAAYPANMLGLKLNNPDPGNNALSILNSQKK
jgi:hypothetical protein